MTDEDPDLARAREGDREAFGRLVKKHQRRVYAAALHITGNHSDADDVTQESFVRAYRGLGSFDWTLHRQMTAPGALGVPTLFDDLTEAGVTWSYLDSAKLGRRAGSAAGDRSRVTSHR